MKNDETIFALATGQGRAGVAMVRVSGPASHVILSQLCRGREPADRLAAVRTLWSKADEELDRALVIKFSGPKSFTGEDMVELHLHGGEAVIEGVSRALFEFGLRQAEAGEFTRRAFANGRMDLTEAEGLADLIDATSEMQKRQALMQMGGGLRDRYEDWRTQIIGLLARIEGELDFADEGDVPSNLSKTAGQGLRDLEGELRTALADGRRGERVRHGLDVAVIGAPNAGKSSLINALGGRDIAIVSPEAGTTRDIVEVQLEIGGLPVRLSDTAGLRETDNLVEKEGVRRALARAGEADIKIGVVDLDVPAQVEDILGRLTGNDILVLNKCDLTSSENVDKMINVSRETLPKRQIIVTSLTSSEGVEALETLLQTQIKCKFQVGETSGLTRARHRDCVERVLISVQRAGRNLLIAPEVSGTDLVSALHSLKELAGETDIEAVLDRVFSSFCIGK